MGIRLSQEIGPYQQCLLVDSGVEAAHRDVSLQARRACAGTLSWWASSVHLEQNLALEAPAQGNYLIFQYWPKWNTLLRGDPDQVPNL